MKKITALLSKYLTPKTLSIILTLLYLASLVPLFWIARYNYPSADDYSIGETCRHAWLATHNIFAVVWEAALMAVHDYFNWMGYFSSIFFMSVHPGVFGDQGYTLTTWIMVGMLSFSTIALFRAIMVKALKIDPYLCHSITMMTLLVMVQCMVGRTEAFYWYCGAVNYIFLHSAGMFFLGGLIFAYYEEKRPRRIRNLIVAAIMGIWSGAGNYMTALDIAIILAAAGALMIYFKKWKNHYSLLIPIGFYTAAFAASVLAPGNSVRSAGAEGMNPVKAVFTSFYYAFAYALSDWTNWVVILLAITLIPLFWKAAKQVSFRFPYPALVAGFSFCLLSATITPPLFAVGNIMAGRLQALIFVMYILLLVLNIIYLTGWAQKKLDPNIHEDVHRFSPNTLTALICCGTFLVFGSALSVIPEPHYFTFSSAITDLSNGSAQAYGAALLERAELLNRSAADSGAEKRILLEPLPAKPMLLYFDDITPDPGDWKNRAMARYYQVDEIILADTADSK